MGEVKGTWLHAIGPFIQAKHGKEGWERFLAAISPEARAVYTSSIMLQEWYPFEVVGGPPLQTLCDLFYNGMPRGAWELGRFAADGSLGGIYKIWIRFRDPMWTVQRASQIFSTYFRPGRCELVDSRPGHAEIHNHYFPGATIHLDRRTGGWYERAFEIMGANSAKVSLVQSAAEGASYSKFVFEWT